jgi:DnaK suppressor protein
MPSKKNDNKKKTPSTGADINQAAKANKPGPTAKEALMTESEQARNERLRRLLLQKREEILKESKKEIKKQISGENRQFVETVLDDGDLAVVDVSEEINLKQLTAHRQMLLKIDLALNKLREGSYGICEECGGEIEEGRLKVLPFAVCCRDCQEMREEMDKLEPLQDS